MVLRMLALESGVANKFEIVEEPTGAAPPT
jgi:hypothetical protein